jgi:hypothetical protein
LDGPGNPAPAKAPRKTFQIDSDVAKCLFVIVALGFVAMKHIDDKFDGIDIDKKFDGIDKKFDGIDKKFDGEFDDLNKAISHLTACFEHQYGFEAGRAASGRGRAPPGSGAVEGAAAGAAAGATEGGGR